jgi:hypothetical protein
MGLKEWKEKRKLLKEQKIKEVEEKKQKELDAMPKCSNCGKGYLTEIVGPNSEFHQKGFCTESCMINFIIDNIHNLQKNLRDQESFLKFNNGRVDEISTRLDKLEINVKKIVKYLLSQKQKIVQKKKPKW